MKVYDQDSPEFNCQTAVMMALPHAEHPMHGGNWRTKADALIEGLAKQGYVIVRNQSETVHDYVRELPCMGCAATPPAHEPWCPNWKAPQ